MKDEEKKAKEAEKKNAGAKDAKGGKNAKNAKARCGVLPRRSGWNLTVSKTA